MNRRVLLQSAFAALLAVGIAACAVSSPSPGEPTPAIAPSAVPSVAQNNAQLAMWAVSGMERVGRDAPPGTSTQIELYAARGEYEPFQVAVHAPPAGLSNLRLTVSDLSGDNGATISREQLTLYREHYVEVRDASPNLGGTNQPLGAGWYADALIPFEVPSYQSSSAGASIPAIPVSVAGEQNQPFWIDIFVPRAAAPGIYHGSFVVASDQGRAEGQITLHVWNFELPLKPTLLSSFDLEQHNTLGNMKELLRHHLMPKNVPPEAQRELIDQWGLGASGISGFWSGANVDTCKMKSAPKTGQLRDATENFQRDLLIYNYTADEIDRCPELTKPLTQWANRLHDTGIANLVTMVPTTTLLDAASGDRSTVDIWGVLPKRYDANPALAAVALARGTQIWSYNAGVQDAYSPKWQIDFAPIDFRIQAGFISQSLGFSGLLYWRVDGWTDDPWNNVSTYSNGKYTYSGDGMLVYPGEQVGINGVVPSMRLKWLREGVEDYEYVALLKQRGQGDWALGLARQVGADWHNWTQDPHQLENVRRQLGEALSTHS